MWSIWRAPICSRLTVSEKTEIKRISPTTRNYFLIIIKLNTNSCEKKLTLPYTWNLSGWVAVLKKNAVLGVLINHVIIMAPPCHKKVPRAATAVYCKIECSRAFPHPYFLPAPCLNISLKVFVWYSILSWARNELDPSKILSWILAGNIVLRSKFFSRNLYSCRTKPQCSSERSLRAASVRVNVSAIGFAARVCYKEHKEFRY